MQPKELGAEYGTRKPKTAKASRKPQTPKRGHPACGDSRTTPKAGMKRQARNLAKHIADLPFP